MKIVIIDDEPKVRSGLTKVVSAHPGWQVMQSFDEAESAIEYLKDVLVDVVITDIRMPGINGLDMIAKLKETNHRMVFVVLSGYQMFEYAQRAIDLGVKKFLVKPTSPKDVTAVLEQIEQELDLKAFQDKKAAEPVGRSLLVTRAEEYINRNYRSKFTLKDVAENLYVSPNYLSNLFKEQTGKKFSDYLMDFRLERSLEYLKDVRYSIAQTAELVGFSDYRYYSSAFRKRYNESPIEYRNSHCI